MEENRFHTGEKSAQKNTLLYACRLAECSRQNDETAVSMVSVPYVRRFVNRRRGRIDSREMRGSRNMRRPVTELGKISVLKRRAA